MFSLRITWPPKPLAGVLTLTDLSPAAQAVLDAFLCSLGEEPMLGWDYGRDLAAALRAAAHQVVPVPIKAKTPEEHWALLGVKNKLLAIADELENVNA